jgi:hypothetical protein
MYNSQEDAEAARIPLTVLSPEREAEDRRTEPAHRDGLASHVGDSPGALVVALLHCCNAVKR